MFYREDDLSSDTYNGADRGHYRWSQTGFEVDIKVELVLKYCYIRLNTFTQLSLRDRRPSTFPPCSGVNNVLSGFELGNMLIITCCD